MLEQMHPVVTLEPNVGYLYSVSWSPPRPLVIAVVTDTGHLIIYDLKKTRTAPAVQLDASNNNSTVHSVQFNHRQ